MALNSSELAASLPNLRIRREEPHDIPQLHALVAAAFGRADEARLLDRLRDEDALLLSHVALLGDELLGQAAYSLVSISDDERVRHFPALGPIAVSPAWQRQGIGSALVWAGLAALRAAGYGLLFLVGHRDYYPRFGFVPALPQGFTSDYVQPGGAHEHFMVVELADGALGAARGHVRFHSAFAEV
ncbi:MAG: N-acetyltransferase [Chloroflexi bacterium]|nr:N-acetyltransferase [Chloroflexota bacterium]MCY3582663.1 N-acetyltransferase [Chloroflexota bacterium]